MKKLSLPILLAGSLSLAGCAYGMNDPTGGLAGVLGSVLGGGTSGGVYGQGGPDFQETAIDACGREASRYGQVRVSNVQQVSRDTLRVSGTITSNYDRRSFGCSFRADGRITDFDVQ